MKVAPAEGYGERDDRTGAAGAAARSSAACERAARHAVPRPDLATATRAW
ncbi:MAG: hypothetical protein MZV49_13110 [Rhodopseudomonas palustris]|nr:hypothetical protein [Rhodopseudomonas palustris]